MSVRWLLIPTATLACCFAQQPEKPVCNVQNRGKIWPERNARTAGTEIQMCTLNVWKYRSETVTVPVSQLAKDPKRGTAAMHRCPGAANGSEAPTKTKAKPKDQID